MTTPTPPSPNPTQTFSLFTSLPPELRLKIWSLNLPPPRLIPLTYLSTTNTFSPPYSTHQGCTSPTRIPSNLHTNHESRSQALKSYTLHFNLPYTPAKIYFNPSIDILHFGAREEYMGSFKHFINATTIIAPKQLACVRRLSVSQDLFTGCKRVRSTSVTQPCLRDFWSVVRGKFINVKEVWIVPEGWEGERDLEYFDECGGMEWERREDLEDAVQDEKMVELDRLHDASRDKEGKPGTFYWEVLRAVAYVEERWGWEAPAWRVMGVLSGVEDEEIVVVEEKLVDIGGRDVDLDVDLDMMDCGDVGFVAEFTGDFQWVGSAWEDITMGMDVGMRRAIYAGV